MPNVGPVSCRLLVLVLSCRWGQHPVLQAGIGWGSRRYGALQRVLVVLDPQNSLSTIIPHPEGNPGYDQRTGLGTGVLQIGNVSAA